MPPKRKALSTKSDTNAPTAKKAAKESESSKTTKQGKQEDMPVAPAKPAQASAEKPKVKRSQFLYALEGRR